jgi:hypothetical protein
MKKIFITTVFTALLFTSCIKNEEVIFKGSQVEFDAAIWNANSAGITYPILTRIPAQGIATPTSQPTLTRTSGTVQLRVNLVGAQSSSPITFNYQVVSGETTAVAGTHFTALSGTGTIPANSSFGLISVDILNPGATSGSKVLVLQLIDGAGSKVSFNYSKVGLSISQS